MNPVMISTGLDKPTPLSYARPIRKRLIGRTARIHATQLSVMTSRLMAKRMTRIFTCDLRREESQISKILAIARKIRSAAASIPFDTIRFGPEIREICTEENYAKKNEGRDSMGILSLVARRAVAPRNGKRRREIMCG